MHGPSNSRVMLPDAPGGRGDAAGGSATLNEAPLGNERDCAPTRGGRGGMGGGGGRWFQVRRRWNTRRVAAATKGRPRIRAFIRRLREQSAGGGESRPPATSPGG